MSSELRFEWDIRKAETNLRKHKVSFELAAQIFDDPFVFEFEEGNDHGETRFRAIGQSFGQLFCVSYTSFEESGDEVIRIISARKATHKERRAYQGHSQTHR
jgi:uncharacterized DUF497 family protein